MPNGWEGGSLCDTLWQSSLVQPIYLIEFILKWYGPFANRWEGVLCVTLCDNLHNLRTSETHTGRDTSSWAQMHFTGDFDIIHFYESSSSWHPIYDTLWIRSTRHIKLGPQFRYQIYIQGHNTSYQIDQFCAKKYKNAHISCVTAYTNCGHQRKGGEKPKIWRAGNLNLRFHLINNKKAFQSEGDFKKLQIHRKGCWTNSVAVIKSGHQFLPGQTAYFGD